MGISLSLALSLLAVAGTLGVAVFITGLVWYGALTIWFLYFRRVIG